MNSYYNYYKIYQFKESEKTPLKNYKINKNKKLGPGENWTRIARFRVLSDNRYTTGPACFERQCLCY